MTADSIDFSTTDLHTGMQHLRGKVYSTFNCQTYFSACRRNKLILGISGNLCLVVQSHRAYSWFFPQFSTPDGTSCVSCLEFWNCSWKVSICFIQPGRQRRNIKVMVTSNLWDATVRTQSKLELQRICLRHQRLNRAAVRSLKSTSENKSSQSSKQKLPEMSMSIFKLN